MEQRLSMITLGVTDPARAKSFYEALGWKPAFENETIVFIPLNGIVLALFERGALEKDIDRSASDAGAFALAYNVRSKNEVDPLIRQAAEAGGTILKSAEEAFWGGYSGYFADPDGHAWEVAWNPHWRISEAGDVVMS